MPNHGRPEYGISLSSGNFDLHHPGRSDQTRHNEKIKDAIRNNLPHLVGEEDIITSDGKTIVKIPIKGLELPRFRHGNNEGRGFGQGEGQVGDVIGQAPGQAGAQGVGRSAGNEPGIDYYEAEITIDDLAELLFEDLGLPNLEDKGGGDLTIEAFRFRDISKKGPMSNLDRRRTILQNIQRRARSGLSRSVGPLEDDDLRFKTWEQDIKPESNAVVIAMRDVSGSMGEFEKYISRSSYFWIVRLIRHKYQNVKIAFITHHAQAKEVDEQTFFSLGESGGTKASTAYKLALDLIKERYQPERWNIYPFHFSDGDNWGDSDNQLCLDLINQMLDICNMVGYAEIQQEGHGSSTLMTAFSGIKHDNFVATIIKSKKDVYPALKNFFDLNRGKVTT